MRTPHRGARHPVQLLGSQGSPGILQMRESLTQAAPFPSLANGRVQHVILSGDHAQEVTACDT